MINKQRSFYVLRLYPDLLLICIAFLISAVLAQSFDILLSRSYMFLLLPVMITAWYISSNIVGFYEDYTSRSFPSLLMNLQKIAFVQALVTITFIFATKEDLFTRNFLLYYYILLNVFIITRVVVFWKTLKYFKRNKKLVRNILVVGAKSISDNLFALINDNMILGYELAGFVSDNPEYISGENYLGSIGSLERLLSERNIHEVIIALSSSESSSLEPVVRLCNKFGVRTHLIPDYSRFLSTRFRVSTLGTFPIITIRNEPLEEFHLRMLKRSFDVVFSLLVIVFVLSWLTVIIAIMQKILSPGPVFFLQDRIGKNNRIFRCYKFRSMKVQPKQEKFVATQKNDPRVTPFGKFLRKSNIDELPQFINVLFGDMSIVGPRPHAVAYNEVYKEYVEHIKLRHLVKPGITGWAQVNGLRGDVEDPEEQELRTKKRIEHDLWYIENWSFGLDIQIILMTIWQSVRGNNRGL